MDDARARALLQEERIKVQRLLDGASVAAQSDREAIDQDAGSSDAGELLSSQGTDDALTAELRERLAALARAEERLDAERSVARPAADTPSLTTASKRTLPPN